MDQHIERILRQIPGWSISEAVVSPRVGGITNQNYPVDIGGQNLFLLHGGPAFPGSFSPFETVRNYHKLALKHGVKFPDTLTRVFALMVQIEAALAEAGMDQVKSCHNDLLASNFIDDGRNIWIVDWEYAGMGDIFFDLGNFAVNQSLNDEQCQLLLQYYFGELRPADRAHLHLLRLGSDLRESFWGFLQLGISELDFDYREYAHHHLNRFLHNVETSPFEQWLRDVRL